jgi:hypothetical protein
LILKEKIEDFLHHDYVRMVYTKKSSKIRLKFGKLSRKISKKGVFIKNIYQKYIKRLSKRYQKLSKRYQKVIKALKTYPA